MEYSDSKDIEKLLQWLQVREQNGIPFPSDLIQLWMDISHSSLLRRLLDGKEPLLEAPPLSYSYPWYYLVENGKSESNDVHPLDWQVQNEKSGEVYQSGTYLCINQSLWRVLQKISDDEYICTYENSKSTWKVERIVKSDELWKSVWTITRITE